MFEELASILRKTTGLADGLAQALAPLAGQVRAAFVFGSSASGKTRPGSDVDVLLIGGDLGYGEVVSALYPAQETLGREINPKLYSATEWRKLATGDGAFYRDVMARPKLFLIGGEEELGYRVRIGQLEQVAAQPGDGSACWRRRNARCGTPARLA